MTLIKSISGIRGTIGGAAGENLTPIDVVRFTAAFGSLMKQRSGKARPEPGPGHASSVVRGRRNERWRRASALASAVAAGTPARGRGPW